MRPDSPRTYGVVMEIQWLNAVIDIPADHFGEASDFWTELTATTLGEVHPDHDEFVHLIPRAGDGYLEMQRIEQGPAAAHLDLVVDDIPAWRDRAVAAGARVVAEPGHVVLHTPGGVPFCIVPYTDEAAPVPVIDAQRPHAADQICLDVPHDHFEADIAFWAELTGWAVHEPTFPEFRSFVQPAHLPLRILIQQLGPDDTGGGRAHLDVSSGEHVAELTKTHVEHGADVVEVGTYWTALRDPAGMPYCLTSRPPTVG